MSQTADLIEALKKSLKHKGMTYSQLARALDLSEAAVKRMFSEGNFTLKRLNDICDVLGIEFADLTHMMEQDKQRVSQLTETQEQQIASDLRLMLTAFLVINGFTLEDITEAYHFTEIEAIQYLIQLDKLGIIELLPNNRIKLIISSRFAWRKDGPMQQFFMEKLQPDFLASTFPEENDKHYFISAMLSDKTAAEFESRIESLVQEFKIRNLEDSKINRSEKRLYSFLIAMRPWTPPVFDQLRKA